MDPSDGAETGCTMSKKQAKAEGDLPRILANDLIVQRAARVTGCSFEDILAGCRLVPGDPDKPEDWPVAGLWQFLAKCPANPAPAARIKRGPDGKADFSECDQSSDFAVKCEYDVRFALLAHWSCLANLRGEDGPALAKVRRALTGFRMQRQLGEIHGAKHLQVSNGGKASAQSENRTMNLVDVEAEMERLRGTPRREQAAIIAEQLGISKAQVRKLRRKIEEKRA
jgi:hypothetical protein